MTKHLALAGSICLLLTGVTACNTGMKNSTDAQTGSPLRAFSLDYGAGEARTLANGDVVYLEKGRGDAVVLYMPTYDYRYWQFQIDELAQHYHVLAVSGFPTTSGAAPPAATAPDDAMPGFLDPAPLIADVQALRDEFHLGLVHLVTHSIGGRHALQAAIDHPDLFASLVLVEPAGGIPSKDIPPRQGSCSLANAVPVEVQVCTFANGMNWQGYFEAMPAAQRQLLVDSEQQMQTALHANAPPVAFPPQPARAAQPAAAGFPSICTDIAQLTMPILVMRGAKTPPAGQSGLDYYESCLPEHESVRIPGVGHNSHWDAPGLFNAAVENFLRKHPIAR
jgi:pimeloyl-ACP methyl ester carboxylesterase